MLGDFTMINNLIPSINLQVVIVELYIEEKINVCMYVMYLKFDGFIISAKLYRHLTFYQLKQRYFFNILNLVHCDEWM